MSLLVWEDQLLFLNDISDFYIDLLVSRSPHVFLLQKSQNAATLQLLKQGALAACGSTMCRAAPHVKDSV